MGCSARPDLSALQDSRPGDSLHSSALPQLHLRALLHGYLVPSYNSSLPVMKLKEETHLGSRKRRVDDDAQTPRARTLANPHVSHPDKAQLRET